jgi:hypothetical protein
MLQPKRCVLDQHQCFVIAVTDSCRPVLPLDYQFSRTGAIDAARAPSVPPVARLFDGFVYSEKPPLQNCQLIRRYRPKAQSEAFIRIHPNHVTICRYSLALVGKLNPNRRIQFRTLSGEDVAADETNIGGCPAYGMAGKLVADLDRNS